MKKIFLSSFISLFTCSLIFAQDVITTQEGETIQAKVLEVSPDEVKYKHYTDTEGPTYAIKKSDIFMIAYESGRKDVFKNFNSNNDLPENGITPGMKYRDLKKIYNYKNYTRRYDDRHSPGWSGAASFFVPGLGECINGEWGRGLGKTAINIICNLSTNSILGKTPYGEPLGTGYYLLLFTQLSVNIWSVVDASQIAKVKNMYERDLQKLYSFDVQFYPSVNYTNIGNSTQYAPGVTLAINF